MPLIVLLLARGVLRVLLGWPAGTIAWPVLGMLVFPSLPLPVRLAASLTPEHCMGRLVPKILDFFVFLLITRCPDSY